MEGDIIIYLIDKLIEDKDARIFQLQQYIFALEEDIEKLKKERK